MEVKTFVHRNVTVNIHYDKLPTRETLEPICKRFLMAVKRDEEKKKKIQGENNEKSI